MLNFNQPYRPNTIYGPDSIEKLSAYCMSDSVLLLYGSGSIKKTGLYDRLQIILKDVNIIPFGGIGSNPKLSIIEAAIKVCKENNIKQIIAVGGGSVIDGAKAICVGARSDKPIWDIYMTNQVEDALELITVVTNVATGSETNDVSVIVNDTLNLKRSIKNRYIYPKVAIMDPLLTLTVNEYTTKYGVIDCFSHLFEQYFNNINNKIIDDTIVSYMKNVIELGPKLIGDLQNPTLRDNHMYLCYVAYNCEIRNIVGGDFACHGLDYGLASVFDTTHGAGLAIIMPNWMEFVKQYKPQKIASLGRALFAIEEEDDKLAASLCIDQFRLWLTKMRAVSKYEQLNVTIDEIQLDEMIEKSKVSYPLGNYYQLDEKAIKTIYEMGR